MKEIDIYTDGSSLSNPGPSGWAGVLLYKGKTKELSDGYDLSTNNRMEILAAIETLNALREPCKVHLHTDSRYLIDGITKWIKGWIKRGWKDSKKKAVKNKDLWLALLEATKPHKITWVHVKAHSGVEYNERCDKLAKNAAKRPERKIDHGYLDNSY